MTFTQNPSTSRRRPRTSALIPRSSEHAVRRTRLLRRLDRLAPLSIVRALPGAGKTSLVADWARMQQTNGAHVVWLAASAALSRPEAFSSYILDALTQECLIPPLAERLTAAPGSGGWGKETATSLASLDQRIVVIIDDAHHVIDSRIVTELCELLLRTQRLHLVLCTRMYHPLKELARAHGLDVTELVSRDLALTPSELPVFAASWGHDLSSDRAKQIHDVVGGWLTAVKQVLDDTPPDADTLSTTGARAFLREVVLPHITDGTGLRLAMSLAVMERVSVDLVRAVFIDRPYAPGLLGTLSPPELLTHLERHGVLEPVPTDADEPIWCFPILIRRVLADAFVTEFPDEAAHVHRTIAASLAADSPTGIEMGPVLCHARAGGHWSLLERIWSEQSLTLTLLCPEAVISAFENLPAIVISEYPVLALAEAVVACLRHHDSDRDQISIVRSFVDACWTSLDTASLFASRDAQLLGVTAALIARRADGDPAAALELADQFGEVLRADTLADRRSITPSNLAWFELQWSISALMSNSCSHALTLSTRAYATGRAAGVEFISSHAASQLALIHAIIGSTSDAARWLQAHHQFDTTGQWLHRMVTLPAYLAHALLALDRLDQSTVEEQLASAGDGTDATEIWPQLAWVAAQHSLMFGEPVAMLNHITHLITVHPDTFKRGTAPRLLNRATADLMLALGELNRAERFLTDVGAEALLLAVPRARLALIAGDFYAARSIASTHTWNKDTLLRDRVELLMIKAAAALAMGDEKAATAVFSRAHTLAAQIGTLVPYLGIPSVARNTLFRLTGKKLAEPDAGLLTECRSIYPDSGNFVVLSPREAVVLYAMVDHETLADVAKALTVSIHTVKKQTIAIYTKLGVHDRAAALLNAYRLGLLPAPDQPAHVLN